MQHLQTHCVERSEGELGNNTSRSAEWNALMTCSGGGGGKDRGKGQVGWRWDGVEQAERGEGGVGRGSAEGGG